MPASSSRPQGAFRPQRLRPRYAPLLNTASKVPGGLNLTTRLLRPIIKDKVVSSSDSPSLEQLRDAHVAISGYPRTGTTYLQHLINLAYEDDNACWKNHDALSLRWYANNCAVAGITLREPRNTAISNAIYHGDSPSAELMRLRLKSYSAWHREILRTVSRRPISIFRFSDFTSAPERTLTLLCPDAHRLDLNEAEVRRAFAHEGHQEELQVGRRNLPSKSRDSLKLGYEELFEERRVRKAHEEARELFLELDSISTDQFDSRDSLPQKVTRKPLIGISAGAVAIAGAALPFTQIFD